MDLFLLCVSVQAQEYRFHMSAGVHGDQKRTSEPLQAAETELRSSEELALKRWASSPVVHHLCES